VARLLLDEAVAPALAMALDEALSPDPVVVRMYRFAPAAISLGYFQPAADFPPSALERMGRQLVRRVTGGAAIDHAGDLTFSIIAREDDPIFACDVKTSYFRIHEALAAGLATLGVTAAPRGEARADSDSPGDAREAICFHRATSFDVIAGGAKLIGSAQRRTRGRVLHHGSIPLAANALAPNAASLSSLLRREVSFAEVVAALVPALARAFGLEFTAAKASRDELALADRLVAEKYGNDAWTRDRRVNSRIR
jgi:lipoate-protein ligase A